MGPLRAAACLPSDSGKRTAIDTPITASRVPDRGYDLINVLTYDFFATFTAVRYENALEEDNLKNQLNFNYNFSINNRAQFRRFTIRTYLVNEYGFRHYFDSTTEKTTDVYTFRNALQIPLRKNGVSLMGSYEIKSQLWPTRKYRDTDTTTEQYLFSDYLSPGYKVFSLGLSWQHATGATVDLGLVGGKVTRIRNKELYDTRQSDVLYGVHKGEKDATDFGLNLIVNVPPRMVSKKIGWAFNANIFASRLQLGRLPGYTADISNALHFLFLKNLRLTMITQMKYDESIQDRVFWTNQFMIGFYLSNRL
ncbi:MAG: hypothetical protein EOP52_04005 [Sphingobacteriales bacterium]|nr:MAG: hypothetical protein EOP52_04005 [Sphingobacteriales bacterium]